MRMIEEMMGETIMVEKGEANPCVAFARWSMFSVAGSLGSMHDSGAVK